MRRILVDHARASSAQKRGGDQVTVSLENAVAVAVEHPTQLLDVHRALERLDRLDKRRAHRRNALFLGAVDR